jgi:hypothetical protein
MLIYQQGYDDLLDICKQIIRHRQKMAKPKVDEVVCKHIDLDISNEDLLSHLIGESLLKRIDRKLLESKNIYVQEFDIPQIKLFYSMSEAVPFVAASHAMANQYLYAAIRDLKRAAIIDIGIGKGRQVLNLLDTVQADRGKLESLIIIGVDPDESNLSDTEAKIGEKLKEFPVALQFHPVHKMIEQFSDGDFDELHNLGDGNLCINSAFSLHHTRHRLGDNELRTDLFRKFASLKPRVLTLVEPHSNHDTEDLPKRFHHCWEHFGHVFKLIDESRIEDTHKFSIKVKFFGREIRDIFGVSDHFRSERHELYDSWILRMSRAGFKPMDLLDMQVVLPSYCESTVSEGLVRLNYDGVTVVSVMGYRL